MNALKSVARTQRVNDDSASGMVGRHLASIGLAVCICLLCSFSMSV